MNLNEKNRRTNIVTIIYDGAKEVHRVLGPGIPPSIYKKCLIHEMRLRGLRLRQNVAVDVIYKGVKVNETLLAELIIEEEIVVNILEKTENLDFDEKKIKSVLKFTHCSLGILINPASENFIDGWKKITVKKE